MKTDYIYNMPAGEEIDALVFSKVLHRHEFVPHFRNNAMCDICGGDCGSHPRPKKYSTDISAAWEIVEKMGSYKLGTVHTSVETKHEATFWKGMMGFPVKAETAPLAICRSALLALTYKLE